MIEQRARMLLDIIVDPRHTQGASGGRRHTAPVGTPRWILALHALTGVVLALTWLLTLRLQLQFVVVSAAWLQQ